MSPVDDCLGFSLHFFFSDVVGAFQSPSFILVVVVAVDAQPRSVGPAVFPIPTLL